LIRLSTIFLSLLTCCPPAWAGSDFFSVFNAAREIVAGRVFVNEDGIKLAFSEVRKLSPAKAELTVKVNFPNGSTNTFREVIVQEGSQVRLEQIEGRGRPVPFLISVDEPFHVLRIRPINDANTEFLSRECLYQKEERRHFCYIKSRVGSEVFVSVFAETERHD